MQRRLCHRTLLSMAVQARIKRPTSQSLPHIITTPLEPLRDMKPQPAHPKTEHEANPNPKIPTKHKDSPDTVVQDRFDVLKSYAGAQYAQSPSQL